MLTLKPRLSRRQPMEDAATPLPSEETTPPVTNIYFGAIRVARAASGSEGLSYKPLNSKDRTDCSYLSGERPSASPQRFKYAGFGVVLANPELQKRAYAQLWA